MSFLRIVGENNALIRYDTLFPDTPLIQAKNQVISANLFLKALLQPSES
jgi:hypothetical protein